jgi:hypothetical protein
LAEATLAGATLVGAISAATSKAASRGSMLKKSPRLAVPSHRRTPFPRRVTDGDRTRDLLLPLFTKCVEGVFSEVRLKPTHYCGNTSLSSTITSVKVSSISNGKRIMPLF